MKWPEIPLGEVLKERGEVPTSESLVSGQTKIISKISFDTGEIQLRSDGETKTGMILVKPGDLVVSGINAAKGAIAVYGKENEGPVAATIHYGAYVPDYNKVDVRYLWWLLRSRTFKELLLRYVPGGIKTELKAKRLLPIPIPLPSLPEQRRILSWIERILHRLEEVHRLRKEAKNAGYVLIRAKLKAISSQLKISGHVSDILTSPPRNGWSASCDNADDGIPVLSLSAVTGFRYRGSQYKRTSLPVDPKAHYWLKPGDILMSRSNTPELVGHAAIYDGHPTPCIYPDLMMRLEPDESRVNRRFLWYWLQSSVVRDFIRKNAKGTSPTMKKISQGTVLTIPFPIELRREDQSHIAEELDELRTVTDSLIHFQSETAAELDALLPSILNSAFQGNAYAGEQ